jgi:hypothetical protein
VHAKGDYVWLYEKLEATPDDGLDELRARYRQKVRELHPDRHPELAHDPRHSDELVALNTAFDELIEFHRRTGRLPGASSRRDSNVRVPPRADAPGMDHARISGRHSTFGGATHAGATGYAFPRIAHAAEADGRTRGPWIAASLVLLGVISLATGAIFEPAPPALSLPAASFAPPAETTTVRYLERGLNREAVRRLEGDPFLDAGTRFEYGPSYVEFKGDKVVGWYSSPMQPLHVRPGEEQR